MEADYPAAHSMDVLWYAVDRDGFVAAFESGEAGAVPLEAEAAQDDDVMTRLRAVVPAGHAIHDPAGRRQPNTPDELPCAWTPQFPVLLFLSSLDPLREAIASGRAVEAPATVGKAVILRPGSEEELKRWHALPEFQGSYNLYFDEDEAGAASAACFGLYEYHHLTENWISGPYGRRAVPGQPLHIDQLPPGLRQSLGKLRLENVRFADSQYIQPVEHTPCESMESGYLDANCTRIRPIPGKEEEYAENYEDYYSESDIDSEPPAKPE